MAMQIRLDDLRGPEIRALLEEHLRSMHSLSPPESVHALDLAALRRPDIRFWTVWSGAELLGCGALRLLTHLHGEVKSMRTAALICAVASRAQFWATSSPRRALAAASA